MQQTSSKYMFNVPIHNNDVNESSQLDQLDLTKLGNNIPQSNKSIIQHKQPQKQSLNFMSILFPQFSTKSITFIVSIIMFIYYWCIYIYTNTTDSLFGCVVYNLGGKFTPAIRYESQFYRLFASIPLYAGISQTIIGSLTINMFGHVAEKQLRWKAYLAIIFLGGFNSILLSGLVYPYNVSVGSYGIIFGILIIYGGKILSQDLGQYKVLIIVMFVIIFSINFIPLIGINQLDICSIIGAILSALFLNMFFQKISRKNYGKFLNFIGLALEIIMFAIELALIFTLDVDNINIDKFCS